MSNNSISSNSNSKETDKLPKAEDDTFDQLASTSTSTSSNSFRINGSAAIGIEEGGVGCGGGGSAKNVMGGKSGQRRNRKPSSCTQCSKRKLRCNRAAFCDQCKQRGHVCKWEGGAVPLFDDRSSNDANDLREQVKRLEALVHTLTSQPSPTIPNHFLPKLSHHTISASLPNSPILFPSGPASASTSSFRSNSISSSHSSTSLGNQPIPLNSNSNSISMENPANHSMDLRANDLAEALAQLAIKSFVLTEGSGLGVLAKAPPELEVEFELEEEERNAMALLSGEVGKEGGRIWEDPISGSKISSGERFVEEARLFMESLPQRCGLTFGLPPLTSNGVTSSTDTEDEEDRFRNSRSTTSEDESEKKLSPGMLGASFNRATPPIKDVLKYLPSHKQAMSAYKYYSGYVSWYSHPVHLATFESQWEDLQEALKLTNEEERQAAVDPFFLATFLGVLALGLSMMPQERAIRDGFPAEKGKIVDLWMEGAMVALTCGRFLDNPSIEALRAVVVISTYFVFMAPGESSGAGMGLLALGVQVAHSLGLQRDPSHTPSKYTFFESEERRRLFWNLFSLCILSSSCLGRTWAIFDLSHIDTRLPLDATDEEIMDEKKAIEGTEARRRKSAETPMTSLIWRAKLAVQAKKINDRAFGIKPTSYQTILELDKELKEFEESVPARYQLRLDPSGAVIRPVAHITVTEMRACILQISVAEEFIRLHRPWLVLAATTPIYQYSRDQVIKYSRLLLAIYRTPSCVKQQWGGLTYKAAGAAIVLAVEVLTFPDGSDVDALRSCVRSAAAQMETHKLTSSLCRKSSAIVRFLLEKDTYLVRQREERSAKRARSSLVVNPYSNIRAAFSADPSIDSRETTQNSTYNSQLDRFSDYLPHKTTKRRTSSNLNESTTSNSSRKSISPPVVMRPSTTSPAAPLTQNTPVYYQQLGSEALHQQQGQQMPISPYPASLSTSQSSIFGAGDGSFDFQLPQPQPTQFLSNPAFTPAPLGRYQQSPQQQQQQQQQPYIKQEYQDSSIPSPPSVQPQALLQSHPRISPPILMPPSSYHKGSYSQPPTYPTTSTVTQDSYSFEILPSPVPLGSYPNSNNQRNPSSAPLQSPPIAMSYQQQLQPTHQQFAQAQLMQQQQPLLQQQIYFPQQQSQGGSSNSQSIQTSLHVTNNLTQTIQNNHHYPVQYLQQPPQQQQQQHITSNSHHHHQQLQFQPQTSSSQVQPIALQTSNQPFLTNELLHLQQQQQQHQQQMQQQHIPRSLKSEDYTNSNHLHLYQ